MVISRIRILDCVTIEFHRQIILIVSLLGFIRRNDYLMNRLGFLKISF